MYMYNVHVLTCTCTLEGCDCVCEYSGIVYSVLHVCVSTVV